MDIKQGQSTTKIATTDNLVDFFNKKNYQGKLYTGYPILYVGGESITIDAIWISKEYGVIIFDLIEGAEISNRSEIRDEIYNKIKSLLSQYKELNHGRLLGVAIEVISYAPACHNHNYEFTAYNHEALDHLISNSVNTWSHPELFENALSVLQSVVRIKPLINRDYVQNKDSKGAIIKLLEETIANLDNQQEEAIIVYHGGIQRIRGLAGSGKTIVLAVKAAYLHATNENLRIAVTFNTRALKNQFKELVEVFCMQKIGKKPNWENLKIIQAWGSSKNNGIYYEFCKQNSIRYLDLRMAKDEARYDSKSPFDFACQNALDEVNKSIISPTYDAILVDEAQDLSSSFLNICYLMLKRNIKNKKSLIYAYDELQNLNEGYSLPNPKKIFNTTADDTILNKCYRNSRPVLTTAHALGFGIYRDKGLVQFFHEPKLWKDVGYEVESGELSDGKQVTLVRDSQATHNFVESKVKIDEMINFRSCKNKMDQAEKVSLEIIQNIEVDELKHTDIIIINPISFTTKDEVGIIRKILNDKGINSHISGVVNPDDFFLDNSVAFTGINRAKGNEVPMVYIINGHECYSHESFPDRDLIRRRNILFTAITRSKAWVRVLGYGDRMDKLITEFDRIKENDFKLSFKYPSKDTIERMNTIRRDLSQGEERLIKKDIDSINEITPILDRINSGNAVIEDYPEAIQALLKKLMS